MNYTHRMPPSDDPMEQAAELILRLRLKGDTRLCVAVIADSGMIVVVMPESARIELCNRDKRFENKDVAIVTGEQACELGILEAEELREAARGTA